MGRLLWVEDGVNVMVDERMSLALVPNDFGKLARVRVCLTQLVSHFVAVASSKRVGSDDWAEVRGWMGMVYSSWLLMEVVCVG